MRKCLTTLVYFIVFTLVQNDVFAQDLTNGKSFVKPSVEKTKLQKWRASLKGGYTYSAFNQDLSSLPYSRYVPKGGMSIGLSIDYNINDKFYVSSGIDYWQKRYRFERTNSYAGWYSNYTPSYFQIPVTLGINIINTPYSENKFWMRAGVGAYIGILGRLHVKGKYPSFAELEFNNDFPLNEVSVKYDFSENINNINRMNLGLQSEAQIGYSLKKIDVFAGFKHNYHLNDWFKESSKKHKARLHSYAIEIRVGYKF